MRSVLRNRFVLFFALSAVLIAVGLFPFDSVSAQETTYEVLQPLGDGVPESYEVTGDLSGYINTIFRIVLGLAGVLAVLMIVVGGFQYMVSGDNPSKKNQAKERITSAILGLLLGAGSVLILTTVNPDLLNFTLDINLSGEFGGATAPGALGCTDEAIEAGYGSCEWANSCSEPVMDVRDSYCAGENPGGQTCCAATLQLFGFCLENPETGDITLIKTKTREDCISRKDRAASVAGDLNCDLINQNTTTVDACPVPETGGGFWTFCHQDTSNDPGPRPLPQPVTRGTEELCDNRRNTFDSDYVVTDCFETGEFPDRAICDDKTFTTLE